MCSVCEREFNHHSLLWNHVRIHDNIIDRILQKISEEIKEEVNISKQLEEEEMNVNKQQ